MIVKYIIKMSVSPQIMYKHNPIPVFKKSQEFFILGGNWQADYSFSMEIQRTQNSKVSEKNKNKPEDLH